MKLIYRFKLCLVIPLLLLASCQDFFEVAPDDMLEVKDYENGKNSIYSGFIGVVGTVREQLQKHVVLSELLGDLVVPTENAPEEYSDVYRYRPAADNKIASPAPYYRIILESNDFLRHILSFEDRYPATIPAAYYRGMISTVINYRAWAYLQLAKIYGEAIYYDYSLNGKNNLDNEPMLQFEDIIEEMIYFMKNGVDGIDAWQPLDWKTLLNVTTEEYNIAAIDPDVLLCELSLWNKDYQKAIVSGLNAITERGWKGGSPNDTHKLTCSGKFSGSPSNWAKMFAGYNSEETDSGFTFDFTKNQTNMLQNIYSNLGENSYYLAPSEVLMSKYVNPTNEGDIRGIGATIDVEDGEFVIKKFHLDREPDEADGPIALYRAGEIHLMIAEAYCQLANKDDQNLFLVEVFLNEGLRGRRNTASFQSSYRPPFDPIIWKSDKIRDCIGVRGRAKAKKWKYQDFMPDNIEALLEAGDDSTYHEYRRRLIDSLVAEETALELAGEGKRWFTLMRIAKNLNKPEMLAVPMSMKFEGGEAEVYKKWLMDTHNWFIKVDHRGKEL